MFNVKVLLLGLFLYFVIINATNENEVSVDTMDALDDLIISQLTNTLECLRQILREGNSTTGLPSFDPFEIEGSLRIPLNLDFISGVVTISDLLLEGIPDFETEVTSTSTLLRRNIGIRVTFDSIRLSTGYSMEVLFLVARLVGDGDVSFQLENVTADLTIEAALLSSPLLRNPRFALTLGNSTIKITGINNDDRMSDIISRQLESTITSLISEQSEVVSYYVEGIITDLVRNITLSSITGGVGTGILNC